MVDMEKRVSTLESWKKEVHPQIERLSRELKANTDATKRTEGSMEDVKKRLGNIETNTSTIAGLMSAGKIGFGALKWVVGVAANMVMVLTALHWFK